MCRQYVSLSSGGGSDGDGDNRADNQTVVEIINLVNKLLENVKTKQNYLYLYFNIFVNPS